MEAPEPEVPSALDNSLAKLRVLELQAEERKHAALPDAGPLPLAAALSPEMPALRTEADRPAAKPFEPGGRIDMTQSSRGLPKDPVVRLAHLNRSLELAYAQARSGALANTRRLLEEGLAETEPETPQRRLVAEQYGRSAEALLDETRVEDARQLARSGLEVDPEAAYPRLVLGQIAYGENDLDSAVAEFERGQRANPEDPQLASWISKAHAEQKVLGHFQTHSSAHFILTFEGDADREVAAFATDALENSYQQVNRFLGVTTEDRIPVVLYPAVAFDSLEQPGWVGGLYDGKLRVPTQGVMGHQRDFKNKLAHEYTHAILHHATQGAWVPAWFNEGLAMVAENKVAEDSTTLACSWGHRAALKDLDRSFVGFNTGQARRAYPTARHAVERLLERHRDTGLQSLVQNLQSHESFPVAFEHAMGESYASFVTVFDAEGAHP